MTVESYQNENQSGVASLLGTCYVERVCDRIWILVHASIGRRIGNLFEMKENMITPERVVDTFDTIRSVYFNFCVAAAFNVPPIWLPRRQRNAIVSALMASYATAPRIEKENEKNRAVDFCLNSNLCALNVNIGSSFLLFVGTRNPTNVGRQMLEIVIKCECGGGGASRKKKHNQKLGKSVSALKRMKK